MANHSDRVRRGLPRVVGGDPWPVTTTQGADPPGAPESASAERNFAQSDSKVAQAVVGQPGPVDRAGPVEPAEPVSTGAVPVSLPKGADFTGERVRRGLPRVPGGQPWPVDSPAPGVTVAPSASEKPSAPSAPEKSALLEVPAAQDVPTVPQSAAVEPPAVNAPKTEAPAVRTPTSEPAAVKSPSARGGKRIALQIARAVAAVAVIVLVARGITTLPGVDRFLAKYPGEIEPGRNWGNSLPGWARWAHFLNFFFIALLVRTGLLVRYQERPDAFYKPKRKQKISFHLWLHLSVDILWVVNGLVFALLLFVSGQWVRIVPTSWDVFPNAASTLLQYLTLDWPAQGDFVRYNALQLLMYFAVVFIAAPLAALTGIRMSQWWSPRWTRLNRFYPLQFARAVHFPVMVFFVLFVAAHVFLVFTTGALRNLNFMFAGEGSASWAGLAWFGVALLTTALAVWAARPLILAPIANLFGRVSER